MVQQPLPVIVSIATLPSRIGDLRPTLESLLDGDLVPDRILVIVTERSERENCGYVIPDFLADECFTRGIIEVVVASRDWGPGTKLLGALEHITDKCYLILADDDVVYRRQFLSILVTSQSANLGCSFSYFTYRTDGLTIGQGCDGFSFYSPNLEGVREFATKHVVSTSLMYHDDLWISFFLFKTGIKVVLAKPPVTGELVYSQHLPNDGLSSIASGELVRDKIVHDGLPRLIRQCELNAWKRASLFGSKMRDLLLRFATSVVHRTSGIFARKRRKEAGQSPE